MTAASAFQEPASANSLMQLSRSRALLGSGGAESNQSAKNESIIPPVGIDTPDGNEKIGKVSEVGSWEGYYRMAESVASSQFAAIWPLFNASDFTHVLEVGCGACRNTELLLPHVGHIMATDIDPTAVERCKERFGNRTDLQDKVSYATVDGVHLPVSNKSISLIYQFDSGVHFHPEVIRGYLHEFARVLKPGGTGFFHHSNLAGSENPVKDAEDVTVNRGWRSNMSKVVFAEMAKEAGLEMLCHPLVTWSNATNLDAFARFRKPGPGSLDHEECPTHVDIPDRNRLLVMQAPIDHLREYCTERGLDSNGSRSQLIARLLEYLDAPK